MQAPGASKSDLLNGRLHACQCAIGGDSRLVGTWSRVRADRFRGLPLATVAGIEVPVAITARSRLLGLALLDRHQTGPGLLLPCCRSVHTAGMRFALEIRFIGRDGAVLAVFPAVAPWRLVSCPAAAAVLEIPAWERRADLGGTGRIIGLR